MKIKCKKCGNIGSLPVPPRRVLPWLGIAAITAGAWLHEGPWAALVVLGTLILGYLVLTDIAKDLKL